MNTFVWSDLHIRHANLATKFRPSFGGTIESHDTLIQEVWNETVGPKDEVWIIGDAAMGKRTESVPIFASLHGRKHLVGGNHDSIHPMFNGKSTFNESIALYSQFFTIHDTLIFGDDAFGIPNTIVCHFPWIGSYVDHAEDTSRADRYAPWHPRREDYSNDTVVIHGHVHAAEIFGDHAVHVGVDAHPNGPIPVEVLAQYVETARQRDETPTV